MFIQITFYLNHAQIFVLNILYSTWLSKEGYTAVIHSFTCTHVLDDCTDTEYRVNLFLKQFYVPIN